MDSVRRAPIHLDSDVCCVFCTLGASTRNIQPSNQHYKQICKRYSQGVQLKYSLHVVVVRGVSGFELHI